MNFKETKWYILNLRNFSIVLIRVFFKALFNPKLIPDILFSVYVSINYLYQSTHGYLKDFRETDIYKRMLNANLFASSNVFNIDFSVSRPYETIVLASLTRLFNPKKVFEIGTYNGFSTMHFLVNIAPDAIVYTLDLPFDFDPESKAPRNTSFDDLKVIELSRKYQSKRLYKNNNFASTVEELFGDSKTFDFTPYYNQIDLIYIDGNHSYEYVKSDTENAFKMLSANGVIIWHDYDYTIHRDIFKYLNALSKEKKLYFFPNTRFAIYMANDKDLI